MVTHCQRPRRAVTTKNTGASTHLRAQIGGGLLQSENQDDIHYKKYFLVNLSHFCIRFCIEKD